MEWEFWRRVLLISLIILIVIVGYKRLLQLVGGKERFNNKFAFLGGIEKDELGNLVMNIDLPEHSTVSITGRNNGTGEVVMLMEQSAFDAGKHLVKIDSKHLQQTIDDITLITQNQRIERKL